MLSARCCTRTNSVSITCMQHKKDQVQTVDLFYEQAGYEANTVHSLAIPVYCSCIHTVCYTQELDRAATETVRRLFDKINGALYEGWSTGSPYVDQECQEWSSTFPHLELV